jgi:hypothetical protein
VAPAVDETPWDWHVPHDSKEVISPWAYSGLPSDVNPKYYESLIVINPKKFNLKYGRSNEER